MKADVIPADTLVIPAWVPGIIAQSVRARYAADVDRAYEATFRESGWFEHEYEYDDSPCGYRDELIRDDVVLRERITDLVHDDLTDIAWLYRPLTCDPRMESVWRDLSRHKSEGGFYHPAIGIDQDAAMLELFNVAVRCRKQNYKTTTTQRQAESERDGYVTKANELRDDAGTMLLQSPPSKCRERYQKLEDAAQAYEDLASEIYAAESATAFIRKHDDRARWVALTIGGTFRKLFGQSMYVLTTTIATVVLDREIEPRTVREWLQAAV